MLLNCGVGEDSWESLRLQGDPTNLSWRRSVLGVHWKNWCWGWNQYFGHLMRRADSLEKILMLGKIEVRRRRGWYGWMASPTQWTWAWVDSRSCWWTGRPGMLWFTGSQRVRHDWVTELNWWLVYYKPGSLEQQIFISHSFGGSLKSQKCWLLIWRRIFSISNMPLS